MSETIVNIQNLNLNIFTTSKEEGLDTVFKTLGIKPPGLLDEDEDTDTEDFLEEYDEDDYLYDYLLDNSEEEYNEEPDELNVEEPNWKWGENIINGVRVIIDRDDKEGDKKSLGSQILHRKREERLGFFLKDPDGVVYIFPNVSRFLRELKDKGIEFDCCLQAVSDLGKGRGRYKHTDIQGWRYAGDDFLGIDPYK